MPIPRLRTQLEHPRWDRLDIFILIIAAQTLLPRKTTFSSSRAKSAGITFWKPPFDLCSGYLFCRSHLLISSSNTPMRKRLLSPHNKWVNQFPRRKFIMSRGSHDSQRWVQAAYSPAHSCISALLQSPGSDTRFTKYYACIKPGSLALYMVFMLVTTRRDSHNYLYRTRNWAVKLKTKATKPIRDHTGTCSQVHLKTRHAYIYNTNIKTTQSQTTPKAKHQKRTIS